MPSLSDQDQPIAPQLTLFDAVSIIIGIVIGSSIYVIPSIINGHLSSPWEVMVIWTLGGFLCLIGALCYAELATAYPRMGGDYVYLNKAFGPWFGFQFGWAQLAVILTSSIGMMGFVFGEYAVQLFRIGETPGAGGAPPTRDETLMQVATVSFAVVAVCGLTAINIYGIVMGKWTQNILTLTKVVGLGGIVVAGLVYGAPVDPATRQAIDPWMPNASTESAASYGVALILVLYAYGGWNDAAFVAADMRNRRHIPATLLLGTGGIMVIYLLINAAYIQGLGFSQIQGFNPTPIAARVLANLGDLPSRLMSLLVMISALGAMNGLLLTGSRVCSALGTEHRVFADLGRWNPRLGSPVWSLVALAGISIAMVLAVGTETGRNVIDWWLAQLRIGPMPWGKYFGGFNTLFAGTAPIFWLFFLFTGLAVFVLRENDKETPRPFRVPLYPYVPSIFCAMCLFGLHSALSYAELISLIGIVPLLIGVPLYALSKPIAPPPELPPEPAALPPSEDASKAPEETIKAPEERINAPAEEHIQATPDDRIQQP